jgi:hypothetical protein
MSSTWARAMQTFTKYCMPYPRDTTVWFITAFTEPEEQWKPPLHTATARMPGDGKWSKELASIFDHVNEYKYDGGDFALADSLFPESDKLYHFVVNNVNGTKAAFDEGLYEGNFSFYVSENGQPVTIGVSKKEVIPNDWAIFDNFRLYYYGDGDANKPGDFTSAIEDAVTDGKANVVSTAWYTINGVRVDEPKQRGIYIRQDLMSDGTKKSVKVIVK